MSYLSFDDKVSVYWEYVIYVKVSAGEPSCSCIYFDPLSGLEGVCSRLGWEIFSFGAVCHVPPESWTGELDLLHVPHLFLVFIFTFPFYHDTEELVLRVKVWSEIKEWYLLIKDPLTSSLMKSLFVTWHCFVLFSILRVYQPGWRTARSPPCLQTSWPSSPPSTTTSPFTRPCVRPTLRWGGPDGVPTLSCVSCVNKLL